MFSQGSFTIAPGTTPDQLARKRQIILQMMPQFGRAQYVGEGLGQLFQGIAMGQELGGLDKQEQAGTKSAMDAFDKFKSGLTKGGTAQPGGFSILGTMPMNESSTSAAPAADTSTPDGSTFEPFISTVKAGGVNNPYALAAIAATGKAESGWSPKNANRSWGDPSVSGAAGTAGGIMSWRNERLNNLISFATAKGERPGAISPQTQAEFFLQEDPSLIGRLNQAKSPDEAADIMAGAWRFAGYDQPGGEAARRKQLANAYVSQFAGDGGQPAGIAAQPGMAATASPALGYVDPMVSAPNAQPRPQQQTQAAPPLPAPTEVASLPVKTVSDAPKADPGVQMAQAGGMSDEMLQQGIAIMSNPFMPEEMKAQAKFMVDQEVARRQTEMETQRALYLKREEQRLKQQDPNYQLDLETKKANLDKLQNPTTDDMREYEYAVKNDNFKGSFVDFILSQKKAGAASTIVNTGEGDKFYQKLDEKNAETFSSLSDAGIQAQGKLGKIDRLEQLMANAPQGAVGALKQAAGEWGIPTDGLSDIQAASSLIESLVPSQRPLGAGTMSDADIKMYRASLPRLLNQPGGNQLIFQTLRGIAQYEMQMGGIADRVANREISPAEGRRMIKELKNPLADFKPPAEGPTPNEGWKEAPGVPGVKIRLKGSQ